MSKKKATPAPAAPATVSAHGDDLAAFAFHLSETLRLARELDLIPTEFFNAPADAQNDHIVNAALSVCHSREFNEFAVRALAAQGKGVASGA